MGYDSNTGEIYIQLEEFPYFAFLRNGNLKALSSHNQTYGDMWPYSFYQYIPESDTYELVGYVHSEDKRVLELNGMSDQYPYEADISEIGTVYYVGTDGWGTKPMDETDYMEWLNANEGNARELEIPYLSFTEENIGKMTSEAGTVDSQEEKPSNKNVHAESPVINAMKTEMLAYGNFGGNLGQGWLFLALPDGEKQDYQVCFVRSEDEGDRYKPLEEALTEAETVDYVFPDVRDGNTPIGKFVELYLYETFTADEKSGMVLVAIYEADDDRYYDTRVYTEDDGGYGYAVNEFMAAELNQKYHNAEEDYPIWQVLEMPTD